MTPNLKHPAPKKKTLGLSLSVLLALTTGAGIAQAQTAAAEPTAAVTPPTAEDVVVLEEFKVKGIRASAMKAIEVKKNNAQFMEAIATEDIGKFPDNNVVESLQRLPGVQVTDYGAGNIATVTIRGLPDVTTTLNGRNIFTASGLTLSLQDVPTSLVNRIDVMKTRSASHIETGMAGVIDIQTHRPFDFSGHKFAIAAKTTYQEQRDYYDPNISALASNVWKIGSEAKFGALINVSYLTTTYRDQSATPGAQVPFGNGFPAQSGHPWPEPYARIFPDVVAWDPGLLNGLPTTPGSRIGPGAGVEYVLGRDAIFFNETKGQTKRPALNLSLQFAPNKSSEYTFEAFYTGYRNENFSNLLFSFVDWWVDWTPATLDVELYPGTNIIKRRGYIGAVYSFTSGDYVTAQTDSFQYSLGGKWDISPQFKLNSEVVFQDSQFHRTNYFSRAYRNVRNDVSVDFNAGGGLPSFRYLDIAATPVNEANVADPSTWSVQDDGGVPEVWDQGFKNKGSAVTFTTDGTLHTDWGMIKRLKGGVRLDNRKASEASRFAEGDRLAANGGPISLATLNAQFPGIVSVNSGFFDGRAAIPASWASIDGEFAYNNRERLRSLYTWRTGPNLGFPLRKTFDIKEFTGAAYLQVDELKTEIAGHKLTGQFGGRFVSIKTEWDYTNPSLPAGQRDRSGETTVSKFMPSAAFSFEITEKFIARLGYGETFRRPNFGDLSPLTTYTRDVSNIGYGTATAGNPNLKPTTSKSFDLAFEYYVDEATTAHFAVFKRNIDGLVVSTRRRVSFTDNIGPYDYILSEPTNASNGKIDGFEVGGNYFPKNLPGILNGLGLQGSYTHLKSSQDIPLYNSAGVRTGVRTQEFFAVSNDSFSTTLSYERSKFSARASYAWRSAFLHHNEAALFANPLGVYNSAERSLTAQISYQFAKNFVVTLEGTNLTDDVQHSYYGENGATTNNFGNWIVGRTFTLGARYSF